MRGMEYGEKWFVSWHNFAALDKKGEPRKRLRIHDVTLRDGEQQAGVVFTRQEKIEIAQALDALGVDRIEAGMVAVSDEDRDTIRELVDMKLSSEIWTIARSTPEDVEKAVETGADGVGIIILANEQYCKVFRWSVDDAIAKALRAAETAKRGRLKTTLLIADSSRMDLAVLEQIVKAASSGPYDAVALMDTFGALSPEGARHLVSTVRSLTALEVELHPHNDFGLGAANALAGIDAGADIVHTSALGLGERLGNAPLEEVALAGALLYGLEHTLDLSRIHPLAQLVQRCSRVSAAPNKPVVGRSYSQIESGTVSTEYTRLLGDAEPMQWLFPFCPELIGGHAVELVVGKGSGLANIDFMLDAMRLEMDGAAKRDLLLRAKAAAIAQHRVLNPDEFARLAASCGARPS